MSRLKQKFFVSEEKIKQYLLNTDHPDGGNKARFFVNYGFRPKKWQILADALCKQAQNHLVKEKEKTTYGTKYVIEGVIHTPVSKNVLIRTVWIIKMNSEVFELITAYPI